MQLLNPPLPLDSPPCASSKLCQGKPSASALPTLSSAALLKLLIGVQSLDQAAALQEVEGQQQSHSTPLCRFFAQPAVYHLQAAQL